MKNGTKTKNTKEKRRRKTKQHNSKKEKRKKYEIKKNSQSVSGRKQVRIPVVEHFRPGTVSGAPCFLHGNARQRVPVVDTIQSTSASRVSRVLE